MPKLSSLAVATLLAASTAAVAWNAIAAAPPLDASTGTRPTQNAPDPQVDFLDLTLDLQMPDPASKSFTATETLAFKTTNLPLRSMDLNAVDMKIDSAKLDGNDIDFSYDGKMLSMTFAQPLEPNTEHTLVFEYSVSDPEEGMTFAVPDESYPDRPLNVHTKGQPELNRYWAICHDYPNERMRTHFNVTVPEGMKVLANGVKTSVDDAGDGMQTWRYTLDKEHVSYLMSIVIGEFDVVEEAWNGLPVEYWVPPGQSEDAKATFANTKNMLEFFSDKLGDYPWPAYNQSVVYLFGSGGMEHTTATTLYQDAVLPERARLGNSLDGLIAHELAHQWFGDHTTCKTWGHLWLNEGFATYLDAAWHEHFHGRDEYEYELFTTMRRVAASDDVTADGGLHWPYYDEPSETFRRSVSNPYPKGASVIHMLRERVKQLGGTDDDFWNILKNFQANNALTDVEHHELREEFENYTGRDWELFFQQWVERPGCPKFKVNYRWDDAAGVVRLTIEQTQEIAAEYPSFEGELPVIILDQEGESKQYNVPIDGRRIGATLTSNAEPDMVLIDPHNSMLSTVEINLPANMQMRAALDAPTAFARLNAIESLATVGTDEAIAVLGEIVSDGERHWGQRAEAASSLGKMQTQGAREALLQLLNDGIDEPRVRREAVEAIGSYRHADAAAMLLKMTDDESLFVEAAACAGLGDQAATDEIIDKLVEKTNDTGWGLRVRQSAVAALAAHGDPKGLQPAMNLGGYGTSFRSRGTGITSLATLHGQLDDDAKQQIRDFLLNMADDPMPRFAVQAMRAVGSTGDNEAIGDLEKIAGSARREDVKEAAQQAIATIRDGGSGPDALRDLRRRLDQLEQSADAEAAEQAVKTVEPEPATQPVGE